MDEIKNKDLKKVAGGHRSVLQKYVNANDSTISRLLDVLCYHLAIFHECKNELQKSGTVVSGPSGPKPHPSINIMRNSSDMILRYYEKLGLGARLEKEEMIDDIMATIKGSKV